MPQQDTFLICVSDEVKDIIRAHAAQRSESVQAFILRAIRETMYNDIHPRTMDSDREAMRRAFEQFHGTE